VVHLRMEARGGCTSQKWKWQVQGQGNGDGLGGRQGDGPDMEVNLQEVGMARRLVPWVV
jgi:hypothetical protein